MVQAMRAMFKVQQNSTTSASVEQVKPVVNRRSLRPPRIVYVSGNPATLARDLKIICSAAPDSDQGLYQIDSVHPFDVFPQASHVESVAFLSLANTLSSKPHDT